MSEIATVRLLADAWGRWTREADFPFSPDHCINGTRVALGALRAHHIKAKPLSVQIVLFNKLAFDLFNDGLPVAEWPPEAWSVGVGPDARKNAGGWDGHLLCEGDGWTLDVSAAQFTRPGRLSVPGPFVADENLPAQGWATFGDRFGQVLALRRWPDNEGWKRAPGWNRLHIDEVAELLMRMEEER
jgi:hypothetical protein